MKTRDVMTTDVLTITPATPLRDAAATLARAGVSGVPVVGEDGTVVGVLSEADVIAKESLEPHRGGILGWLLEPADPWLEHRLAAATAGEAMSAPAVTIGPDRSVAEAATTMLDEGVNRLPVVDANGVLLGIVTRADLVRAFVRDDAALQQEIEIGVIEKTLWVDPSTVSVAVSDGRVSLAGSVENEAEAEMLTTLVRRVPGVIDVESNVKIRS